GLHRDKLTRALAATGVLGGFIEGLRPGGIVKLRLFGIVGGSESLALRLAAVTHTCGVVVSTDKTKGSVEVVLVERGEGGKKGRDASTSTTHAAAAAPRPKGVLSRARGEGSDVHLTGGLPVRPVKISTDDAMPVPEVDVPFDSLTSEMTHRLVTNMISKGIAWLETLPHHPRQSCASSPHVVPVPERDGDWEEKAEGAKPDGSSMAEEGEEEEKEGEGKVAEMRGLQSELNECWRCEGRILRAGLAVQSFRAGAALLAQPHSASRILQQDGLLDKLLQVSVQCSTAGGLSQLDHLEDLWLKSWNKWIADAARRAHVGLSEPAKAPSSTSAALAPAPGGSHSKSKSSASAFGEAGGGDSGGFSRADTTSGSGSGSARGAAEAVAYLSATAAALGAGTIILDTSAAVAQMMEMGFPKDWCEAALRRSGNSLEQAVNFCFDHSGDMEQILAEEQALAAAAARGGRGSDAGRPRSGLDMHRARMSSSSGASASASNSPFMKQLVEMGFPQRWCAKALAANRNNVDAALTWILSNDEALTAEEQDDETKEGEDDTGDEASLGDATAASGAAAGHMLNPLQPVSGVADIRDDLTVEGVPAGGFASVGARGVLLTQGKWYYEAKLKTSGCMQMGWADASYQGHADHGDGAGDCPHSWAFDGWRRYKWHDGHASWGSRWKAGDVVGCAVDMDALTMHFTLNGLAQEVGMGLAFEGFSFAGGLFPCASFNRREKLRFLLSADQFHHAPPGYRPFMEAVEMK
ncbi:unnamed protein product, partial [Chrysoparadoxa australica]